MKKSFVVSLAMIAAGVAAADVAVKGPDGRLEFRLRAENGVPQWSAAYDGRSVAEWSPLGLETEYGDFTKGVKLGEGKKRRFRDAYTLPQGKRSKVKVEMNRAVVPLLADNAKLGFEVCVGNNDLAFRYFVEKATTVRREATGFAFASGAKMFATQQSKPMTGFAQTKPSYEETYVYD
ncbi:MAG: glycoside hydrolase family 97 N-terminal domain-containing protein, partial [Kiritimatiellia bacterium]